MTSRSRAEIVVDVAAIRHNVRVLRELSGTQMIAVVKADGYGHGMIEAGRAAREGGAEWLAVATLDEAVALRRGLDLPGRVLCWLTVPGERYQDAIDLDIDMTAFSVADLEEIEAAAAARGLQARVQLKVDTGLSRGGATRSQWLELVERAAIAERDGGVAITGIWSHFACADQPDHPANDAQEAQFHDALATAEAAGLRPEVRHLANSAATILRPSSRLDAVRCGIATYGQDPAPGHTPDIGLREAMTVQARLAMVKEIPAGAGVSYGHQWTAPADSTIGVVPVGYGEGVPVHGSNVLDVAVAGTRHPVRGRVCMDQIVIDLEGADAQAGDLVVLFGSAARGEPTAQDWAEACGTINYEIVTRMGGRLTRRYVDSDPEADTRGEHS